MPLTPNPLEQALFRAVNQSPGVLVELWSGPASRAVLAGLRLNIFTTLDQQPATAEELALRLGINARGTGILLETLAALGYLARRGATFKLTPMARQSLTDGGALNVTSFYLFWGMVMEAFFPLLEDSIRTGHPPLGFYDWIDSHPDASRYFQEGLLAVARFAKDLVLNNLPVSPTARRVLDVGGGHGMYAIGLCQKHPQLSAVIFDSATALVIGRQTIQTENMTERVTTHEGNILTDDLGAGFDLALLFNIVHGFPPAQNIIMLEKVKAALNPGGQVIILDQFVGASPLPTIEAITRVMGLSFFHLIGGQTYTFEEVKGWLTTAGFKRARLHGRFKVGTPVIVAAKA